MPSKGRRTKTPSKTPKTALYVVVGLAVAGVAVAVVVLTADEVLIEGDACDLRRVWEFRDVHGIAVNPTDPRELYVATHHGLIRGVNGTDWARVGESQDDFMGFSMHPTNGSVMWSSGHPQNPGRDYRNLGVRISRDGGCTWEEIALRGVDFHAMAVSPANPDHLWGFYGGNLHRSTDGGHEWGVVAGDLPQIVGFAPHPEAADTLYAASSTQGVFRSANGGAAWTPVRPGAPALALAIDPHDPQVMYLATQRGVEKSTDGGSTWDALPLDTGGDVVGYLAIAPTDTSVVYAATYATGIYKSEDSGGSWSEIKRPS